MRELEIAEQLRDPLSPTVILPSPLRRPSVSFIAGDGTRSELTVEKIDRCNLSISIPRDILLNPGLLEIFCSSDLGSEPFSKALDPRDGFRSRLSSTRLIVRILPRWKGVTATCLIGRLVE